MEDVLVLHYKGKSDGKCFMNSSFVLVHIMPKLLGFQLDDII